MVVTSSTLQSSGTATGGGQGPAAAAGSSSVDRPASVELCGDPAQTSASSSPSSATTAAVYRLSTAAAPADEDSDGVLVETTELHETNDNHALQLDVCETFDDCVSSAPQPSTLTLRLIMQGKVRRSLPSFYMHTVSQKRCKIVFAITLCQISTDFDNFWHTDNKKT